MSTEAGDSRRQRVALVIFLVVLAGLVGAILLAARGGDDGGDTSATEATPTASSAPVEHVMLMAVNTPGDAFTEPVGTDVELPPMAAPGTGGIVDVDGDAVGLYGGSMKLSSCQRAKLVGFLDANPDKAKAWAAVQGIDPTEIRSFVAGLTPLVLRADTLVTNHGYFDGQATTFASVLQAGTAVLIDDRGLPVVRCFCGNPLTAAPDLASGAIYDGPQWKGFSPASTVRVRSSSRVIDGFEVVDAASDSLFTRPAGSAGVQDAPSNQPIPQGIEGTPTDSGMVVAPTTAAAPTGAAAPAASPAGTPSGGAAPEATAGGTTVPAGEPVVLFEVTSIAGVSSGPPKQTRFTLDAPAYVTSIMTYHYFNNGTPPGTIALESADGTVYGPWPAAGTEGQGGVANANWTVEPKVEIPAGEYTVVDSDPSTWSWALDTGRRGISVVQGIAMSVGDTAPSPGSAGSTSPSGDESPATTVDCTSYPEGSAMWTLCNHDPQGA